MAQILAEPERQANIALARAQAGELGERTSRAIRLAEIAAAKTPEEIANIKAQVIQRAAAGYHSFAQAKQINTLLDEKLEAERLGNEKLSKEIDSLLEVLIPNTSGEYDKGYVSATDISRFLTQKEVAEIGARGRGEADDLAKRKFATTEEQTAVDIDKAIRENPKSAESLARYQDFNRYTNRPSIRVNPTGKRIETIKLGKVNGKTVTGRQIYSLAKSIGMTVDELYNASKAAEMDILEYAQLLAQSLKRSRRQ